MSACCKELTHVPSSESLRVRISADSGDIFANISKCSSVMACGGRVLGMHIFSLENKSMHVELI